ncbi:MAG: ATP12 family protein [Pseudomonadota bacterium]
MPNDPTDERHRGSSPLDAPKTVADKPAPLKRFYKTVGVRADDPGFGIVLDTRTLKTPAKRALILPSEPLAEAIAAEWDSQDPHIIPETMPLMGIATRGIDWIVDHREKIIDEIADYAETDLLCYRASAPQALVARQAEQWQPLIDWAALTLDAPLQTTQSVLAVEQSPAALNALRAQFAEMDDLRLSAFQTLTTVSGSLILAIAVLRDRIQAEEAWRLSVLDELFQIERWGDDAEASAVRDGAKQEILAAARFLSLLG